MTIDSFIFMGPTISEEEAQQWFPATYMPPISQGDIVSLLRRKPKMIGIIDGYFERVPAVWHKEILWAMQEGVTVVGSASMGALRAAELYQFGMIGIGEIFTWYRDGIINADDEVAVRHLPVEYGYQSVSDALVNIRKTLQCACERKIISFNFMHDFIELARSVHYGQRTYPFLVKQAEKLGMEGVDLAALREFVKGQAVDQKKTDAIHMLQWMSKWDKRPFVPEVAYKLNITHVLLKLIDKDFHLTTQDGIRVTVDMLINHARLELRGFAALQKQAFYHGQLLATAVCQATAVSPTEQQATLEQLRQVCKLDKWTDIQEWQNENHLSPTEFDAFIYEWTIIRKTTDSLNQLTDEPEPYQTNFPYSQNTRLLRELRLNDLYGKLLKSLIAKEKYFQTHPDAGKAFANEMQLYQYYFRAKQIEPPKSIKTYALQLGFSDNDIFKVELFKYCSYQKHCQQIISEWFDNLGGVA